MIIASVVLGGAAGMSVFVPLLNRALIGIPDSKKKLPIIAASFLTTLGFAIVLGLILPPPLGLLGLAGLVTLIVVGELRRICIRSACAGAAPVRTRGRPVRLGAPFTTMDLVVHHYELPVARWSGAPLRIVHLTDLHVHARLPQDYYEHAMREAERADADIAVFTGDFISRCDGLELLPGLLRPVARLGSYAVLGNHDYWTDPVAVRAGVEDAGITVISDATVDVLRGTQRICLSGHDAPWSGTEHSVGPRMDCDLHLALSHTADNVYRIAESGADAVFSGHYHAGQFRLPGLGSIVVPSIYGRRFDHGHFVIGGTHLFVASGIGAGDPPLRIYCQPDIFVVDIVPGA